MSGKKERNAGKNEFVEFEAGDRTGWFIDQLSVGPPVIYRPSKRMKNARRFLDRLKADRAIAITIG